MNERERKGRDFERITPLMYLPMSCYCESIILNNVFLSWIAIKLSRYWQLLLLSLNMYEVKKGM